MSRPSSSSLSSEDAVWEGMVANWISLEDREWAIFAACGVKAGLDVPLVKAIGVDLGAAGCESSSCRVGECPFEMCIVSFNVSVRTCIWRPLPRSSSSSEPVGSDGGSAEVFSTAAAKGWTLPPVPVTAFPLPCSAVTEPGTWW